MASARVAVVERWVAVGLFALGGTLWVVRDAPASPARATRPAVKVGPREARQIELGRRLFFEPAVSAVGKNACSSCHDPEHGFSDPAVKSRDDFGFTPRHSQPVVDVDTSMALHWDGGIKDLREIIDRRVSSPNGGGYDGTEIPVTPDVTALRAADEAVRRDLGPDVRAFPDGSFFVPASRRGGAFVAFDGVTFLGDANATGPDRYREAFQVVGAAGPETIREALAAYVKSLRTSAAPYDRHAAGDDAALSPAAKRGLELFQGRARCAECHELEEGGGWPMLRDGKFHNTGVAWMAAKEGGGLGAALRRVVSGLGFGHADGDPGRGAHAGGGTALRAFKTPSLRDVARRPPYMHDGSLATLADVVKHYASGCGDDPRRDERLRPGFAATDGDLADLVAFLEALTGDERPGLAKEPWKHRTAQTEVVLQDAHQVPLADLEVTLTAAGDRAFRGAERPAPRVVRTDAAGRIRFPTTSYTHVRLGLPDGLVPLGGALVPDTCAKAVVTVPVEGRARLALVVPAGVTAPDDLRLYVAREGPGEVVDSQGRVVRVTPAQVVSPEPLVFRRAGTAGVDGRRLALYEGWVPAGGNKRVLFRLPGQDQPQEITLQTGETRLEIAQD